MTNKTRELTTNDLHRYWREDRTKLYQALEDKAELLQACQAVLDDLERRNALDILSPETARRLRAAIDKAVQR